MKKYFTILFLIIFAFSFSQETKAVNTTVKFITLGNCFTCKTRIEDAVKTLFGYVSVDWDADAKVTTVVYDDAFCNPYIIMKKVASVGHDNEWYRAPDVSYDKLIGTCCEYTRTIDYSKVQIGYLSLMNIWFSVNNDSQNEQYVSVYPTIIKDGFFNIDAKSIEGNIGIVSLYSIDGNCVASNRIDLSSSSKIDVSKLAKGMYLIIISDDKKIIFKTKTKVL